MYTLAIGLDGSQPVFFSNRSAVHQARRHRPEALLADLTSPGHSGPDPDAGPHPRSDPRPRP